MPAVLQTLAAVAVWYPVFLISTTFHEAAHALVAKLGGDNTAYEGGQVSLNPVPHVAREPFGMVLVPLLSLGLGGWMLGWASTPYDPAWAERYPRRSALMSLAGPSANLLLVLVCVGVAHLGILLDWFMVPAHVGVMSVVVSTSASTAFAAKLVSVGFSLNLLLALFNLIPLPPLDGSGALPLILPSRVYAKYWEIIRQPLFGLIGLVVVWTLLGRIFAPVFLGAQRLFF